ncbi:MAG: oligoribonuclease [Deltaproteobacteria bacterium]|nr:MAG: oligoribonuclease [Deltaproteobacteria bacterium]
MISDNRLVWLDLEMTGLDEHHCHILQIAIIITDFALNELIAADITIWQPKSIIDNICPKIKIMHSNNGLLKKVKSSKISLPDAENYIFQILQKHVPFNKGYLIGNSIHVDRAFLKKHMPILEKFLHYRQIDVSSLKVLCHEWYNMSFHTSIKAHTALEDIRQSINELKYLRTNCFKD